MKSDDPFSPDKLRVSPDMSITSEKVITAVPVRKPKRDEFFRVNPDPEFRMDCLTVERDGDIGGEVFIVPRQYADTVLEVVRTVRLFTCMSRRGTLFLWPAKLPAEGAGQGQRYAETALKIAARAETLWCRMWGDRGLGGYAMVEARGNLMEPKWPDGLSFRDLLHLAFEGRIIDRPDHPLIKELRGEA